MLRSVFWTWTFDIPLDFLDEFLVRIDRELNSNQEIMPYQQSGPSNYTRQSYRRRRYRPSTYRRGRYQRRSSQRYGYFGQFGNQASSAYNMARRALSFLNPEFKFLDTTVTAQAISTTANITQLTNLAQGDTDITRDGAQIRITAIRCSGFMVVDPTAVNSFVRVMLVLDKQTNGAIYTTAALLADATAGDAVASPLNLDNKFRFRVLYDEVIALSAGSSSGGIKFGFFLKMPNLKIRYSANVGDITDLASNSLSLFMISNEPTNVPATTFGVRIRFLDN